MRNDSITVVGIRMKKSGGARRVALIILNRFERDHAFPGILENTTLTKEITGEDRSFAHLLVMGVLKNRSYLDWVLTAVSRHPLSRLPISILNILRLGVFELLQLLEKPAAVIVNDYVSLARQEGHQGTVALVNAILRRVAERRCEISPPGKEIGLARCLAITHSHPLWLVEKWIAEFGEEETTRLCEVNNQPPPLCLRINTLKAVKDQVVEALRQRGTTFRESLLVDNCLVVDSSAPDAGGFRLSELPGLAEGWVAIQDEAAQLVSIFAKPGIGETVVDACAAPGGKTAHTASLMMNTGKIIAVDKHPRRLELARRNCQRLGASNIEFRCGDFCVLARELCAVADLCLVDAPCSGTGVLRRKPDIRWRLSPNDITELTELQYGLLLAAADVVRAGGRLVYSTCSLEREENQAVVERFLGTRADYRLEEAESFCMPSSPPLTPEGYLWCLPHRHGTDGTFAARFRRE